jgi:hypothetical protein
MARNVSSSNFQVEKHEETYDILGVTLFILEEKSLKAKKNLGSDHRMIPYHIYVYYVNSYRDGVSTAITIGKIDAGAVLIRPIHPKVCFALTLPDYSPIPVGRCMI